jgi:hypothetical protein
MSHIECKFEDKIIEMSGDIKTLLAEFRAMNGALRETKARFDKHDADSGNYRRKTDIVWAVIHSAKWVILFLFGTGVIYKWIIK